MKKTPVTQVNEQFGNKEKLVEAVQRLSSSELWLDRLNSVKGLGKVSNSKLLRLHRTLSDAQQRFGSRDKLVSAILELQKRAKDAGYKSRLDGYPLPRLLDLHASISRRVGRAQAAASAPAKPKATKEKTAKAKAPKAVAKPAAKGKPKAKSATAS
jgi:hypothetical protein